MEQIEIVSAGIEDIETLMHWRMEVLHHVFALPEDADTAELEQENRRYYEQQLPLGGHAACFARVDAVARQPQWALRLLDECLLPRGLSPEGRRTSHCALAGGPCLGTGHKKDISGNHRQRQETVSIGRFRGNERHDAHSLLNTMKLETTRIAAFTPPNSPWHCSYSPWVGMS